MMTSNIQAVKELQESCASYISQFDSFLSQRRNAMEADLLSFTSQQQDFKNSKLKLMEELNESKRVVEELQNRHSSDQKALEEHLQVVSQMRELKKSEERKKEDMILKNLDLKRKIEEKRRELERKLADQEESKRLQGPALEFYQKMLGLRVRRIEDELVRFTFTCIDEQNTAKEFSFDLLVRVDNYSISKCVPKLNPDRLEVLVEELNETRDFGEFLKQMRAQFVVSCKVLG